MSRARGRLVEDDELRLQDHGAGDGDALALAAGELVRVALGGGGVEADLLEDGGDAAGLVAEAVHGEALGDDLRDRHARGERAVGVLEDHLHVAAERAELGVLPALDVLAEEDDAALGGDEAHDGERERGLAGAGLADDAEGLAGADGDGGVVDRLDVADGRRRRPRLIGNQTRRFSVSTTSGASAGTGSGRPVGSAARSLRV